MNAPTQRFCNEPCCNRGEKKKMEFGIQEAASLNLYTCMRSVRFIRALHYGGCTITIYGEGIQYNLFGSHFRNVGGGGGKIILSHILESIFLN